MQVLIGFVALAGLAFLAWCVLIALRYGADGFLCVLAGQAEAAGRAWHYYAEQAPRLQRRNLAAIGKAYQPPGGARAPREETRCGLSKPCS